MYVLPGGFALDVTLHRGQFEALVANLVERTLPPVRRALRDAGVQPQDIDGVVLVGGATRMPAIRAAVEGFFGRPPLTDLDPDAVVAIGAALQADALAGNRSDDWLLRDVIPLSLGIETLGDLAKKIIPRNSTLPVARTGLHRLQGRPDHHRHPGAAGRTRAGRPVPGTGALRTARHPAHAGGSRPDARHLYRWMPTACCASARSNRPPAWPPR
jgi:cell division ATPase FtsA